MMTPMPRARVTLFHATQGRDGPDMRVFLALGMRSDKRLVLRDDTIRSTIDRLLSRHSPIGPRPASQEQACRTQETGLTSWPAELPSGLDWAA